MNYRERRLQPQPILLPERKSARWALPATDRALPSSGASLSRLLYCPDCNVVVVEYGACFCGDCGTLLRSGF